MQTFFIPEGFDYLAPDTAEIRLLIGNNSANMCHCTLHPGKISIAVTHKTVSEFWHVLAGEGELWRKNAIQESIVKLEPGITIDIPLGTHFQYRNTGNNPLTFLCVTAPPWPGHDESVDVVGVWE